MEINFRTKSASNKAQQEEFLALTPTERFFAFLKLSYELRDFPTKYPSKNDNTANFEIVIPPKHVE